MTSIIQIWKRVSVLILFLLIFINSFSQDPTFSQFYANSLYLSPSFVGRSEEYRIGMNYRDQWPAITGVFNTYSVSIDRSFPNLNSGFGILATYDVAGSGYLNTTNLGFLYSYDINIANAWHLRPGLNFKYYHIGIDISKLVFGSQIPFITPSPIVPPSFDNVSDIDFASSLLAYNDRIWGGITVDHLLTPKTSFYATSSTMPIKFNFYGGAQIIKKTRLRQDDHDIVSVAINFQMQDGFYQTDLGLYYYKYPLIFGVWYRGVPFVTSQAGDAIIGLIGLKTKKLHIGYSYDFTISNLARSSAGSHEISFIYEFVRVHNIRKDRNKALPCPDF